MGATPDRSRIWASSPVYADGTLAPAANTRFSAGERRRYRRVNMAGAAPRLFNRFARNFVNGVVPEPPTVIPPMLMTGGGRGCNDPARSSPRFRFQRPPAVHRAARAPAMERGTSDSKGAPKEA